MTPATLPVQFVASIQHKEGIARAIKKTRQPLFRTFTPFRNLLVVLVMYASGVLIALVAGHTMSEPANTGAGTVNQTMNLVLVIAITVGGQWLAASITLKFIRITPPGFKAKSEHFLVSILLCILTLAYIPAVIIACSYAVFQGQFFTGPS